MNQYAYSIFPLGDSALTLDFGNVIDININTYLINFCEVLYAASIPGVKDLVAAYSSLTIHYDIATVRNTHLGSPAFDSMKSTIESFLLQEDLATKTQSRNFKIPVCYAKKFALDWKEVTGHTTLRLEEVIQIHSSVKYRVFMVGFLPGFAYMGEVDERIVIPRKQQPRITIEPGSVGIAGKQTGIYPLASPGGWQIIGQTPVKLFNKEKECPVLLKAGDEVQFFSITEDEFGNY